MEAAEHQKKRDAILTKKLRRANEMLNETLVDKEREVLDLKIQIKKLNKDKEAYMRELSQKDGAHPRLQLRPQRSPPPLSSSPRCTPMRRSRPSCALSAKIDELLKALNMVNDQSAQQAEIKRLRFEIGERDKVVDGLHAEMEELERVTDEARDAYRAEVESADERAAEALRGAVARWRWRHAIALVQLSIKASAERRAKAREVAVEWVTARESDASEAMLRATKHELESAREKALAAEIESAAMRERSELLEETQAKRTEALEAEHKRLKTTAERAVARDTQLQSAFTSAEERAAMARAQVDGMTAEIFHLRWALQQAEAASAEQHAAAARTVAELNDARAALATSSRAEKAAADGRAVAEAKLRDAEASLKAARAGIGSRLADADRAMREGLAATERMRAVQQQQKLAAVAEAAQQEKVALLLSRLSELEATFGDMLAPTSATARKYLSAILEVTKPEITPAAYRPHVVPPSAQPQQPQQLAPVQAYGGGTVITPGKVAVPPPSRVRLPSHLSPRDEATAMHGALHYADGGGMHAAMGLQGGIPAEELSAVVPRAAEARGMPFALPYPSGPPLGAPHAPAHGRMDPAGWPPQNHLDGARGGAPLPFAGDDDGDRPYEMANGRPRPSVPPSCHHSAALAASTSLPVLRTPSVATKLPVVARGAARVAQRHGISVGELKELRSQPRSTLIAKAPPVENLVSMMRRELAPPLPALPVGSLWQ